MKIVKTLLNIFKESSEESQDWLIAPKDLSASFELYFKDIKVGVLKLDKSEWVFEYSEEFKQQSSLNPIIDFPDINKTYHSKELWPFFSIRVPSVERPNIRELINQGQIDNIVTLLEKFGSKTIANPYDLVVILADKKN